jgi:hypothetical protein
MKQAALTSALVLLLGATAGAQNHCTSEVLKVKGTPVTVGYCVVGTVPGSGSREGAVRVAETYSSPHGSFKQTSPLAFIPGDEPSRVIEDVSLADLGITGTLHLTLVMQGGAVHVEAAMLTPGAITIK